MLPHVQDAQQHVPPASPSGCDLVLCFAAENPKDYQKPEQRHGQKHRDPNSLLPKQTEGNERVTGTENYRE